MSLSGNIRSTVSREWPSFRTPAAKEISSVPEVGIKAPTSDKLRLPQDKPTIVLFMRHCGDVFAEKAFKALTDLSSKDPSIHCIAVSHSSQEATDRWVPLVGGEWEVEVLVDEARDLYALWGLGTSSTWHVYNPWSIYSMYSLAKTEGIWNRATESGSRWQVGGVFAIDTDGVVKFAHVSQSVDDIPNLPKVVAALKAPLGTATP